MSISEIETTDTTRDGNCLRLRFEQRTAITSLQELPPAIERWNSILSAFSLVSRGTPPGARLLDIRGHAPLVIDLVVHADLLAPLQMGVSGCLKSLDELTALTQKIEELRQLNVRDEILKARILFFIREGISDVTSHWVLSSKRRCHMSQQPPAERWP